eukprot:Nitzschia sp. Nitz4//scaffold4_size323378//79257//80345//NITZ4_000638-RA/size323378-processed-gene-0.185-mRNA-1//-1//CDS//3329553333//5598//frame0
MIGMDTIEPNMMNQQFNQQQQYPANQCEPSSSVFNSVDFGRFLSTEFNQEKSGDAFLSKDNAVPHFETPSIFKSKEAFSEMFASCNWDMNMKFPQAAPSQNVDFSRTETSKKAPLTAVLSSRDWMPFGTLGNHVDVPLSSSDIFGSQNFNIQSIEPDPIPEPLPKTNWDDMFYNQLQLVPHVENTSGGSQNSVSSDGTEEEEVPAEFNQAKDDSFKAPKESGASKKRKRKPRKKVLPDVITYVEPNDNDVLLGRGGRSNHHPGNKRYREEVKNLRTWYSGISDKDEKTDLSQCLVDYVHSYNGRFLEKDTKGWYQVPNIVARRKASQALREDTDPEKRAAKRARFLKKRAEQERANRMMQTV